MQPSHPFVQHLALKTIPSIIATEFWMWETFGAQLFSGHIDILQVDGKTVRIIDYKPDLRYDPSTENFGKHFVDSIPQVAAYAIILDLLFGLRASGLKIECVTFNKYGYYLYDPYQAMESSVQFYWDKIHTLPVWHALLPKFVIDRITK